jgi:hypothetical protein
MSMVGKRFPEGIVPYVFAGTEPIPLLDTLHNEAREHDDGLVSISSASLLPVSVPLGFIAMNHIQEPESDDTAKLIHQVNSKNIPVGKNEIVKYAIEDKFPRESGVSYQDEYPRSYYGDDPHPDLDRSGMIVDCRGLSQGITSILLYEKTGKFVKFLDQRPEEGGGAGPVPIFYYHNLNSREENDKISDGLAYDLIANFSETVKLNYYAGTKKIYTEKITIYPCSTTIITPRALVAYYKFNGNTSDSSGMGNHAKAFNGVSYKAGKYGKAVNFDTDWSVIITPITDLKAPFTVSAWINTNKYARQIIFENRKEGVGTQNDFYFELLQNGKIAIVADNLGYYESDVIYELNKWFHVAAVVDETNGLSLYINGQYIGSNKTGNNLNFNSGYAYYIGERPNTNKHPLGPFCGKVDEFSVYNRSFSISEIKTLANE